MRNKNRIIAAVISMVMAIAILSVGIYAATTLNFTTTGGTITFTSKDVHATVHVTQDGADKLPETSYDHQVNPEDELAQEITLAPVELKYTKQSAVFVITVRNDFADTDKANVKVLFENVLNGFAANQLEASVTAKNDQTDVDETTLGTGVEVTAGKTLTITVTVSISSNFDYKSSLAGDYGFNLHLERAVAA